MGDVGWRYGVGALVLAVAGLVLILLGIMIRLTRTEVRYMLKLFGGILVTRLLLSLASWMHRASGLVSRGIAIGLFWLRCRATELVLAAWAVISMMQANLGRLCLRGIAVMLLIVG